MATQKTTDTASAEHATGTQGGTHEQHVAAGQQSHKNTPSASHDSSNASSGQNTSKSAGQGGSHDQHVKAGHESHKESGSNRASNTKEDSKTQGGSSQQHAAAGHQSHKN